MADKPEGGKPENTIIGGFVKGRSEKHHDMPCNIETPKADELKRMDANAAGERLAAGPTGKGGWPKGRKRRTKLAVLGIPSRVLDAGSEDYARCVRLAAAYRKIRVRELVISHGYVSSGASSLLASAAMATAASRLIYEQAAKSPENLLEYLRTAAKLADSARQNELAAWELAAREAVAQKKAAHRDNGTPWMVQDDSGYSKKKPGPKPKLVREQEILDAPVFPADDAGEAPNGAKVDQ